MRDSRLTQEMRSGRWMAVSESRVCNVLPETAVDPVAGSYDAEVKTVPQPPVMKNESSR